MYLNLVIWERLFDRNTRTGKRINETEISRSRWRGLDKIRKIGWNAASIEPLIPAYSKRGRAIAHHSPMVGAAHRAIAPTQPRWKEWKRGCKCGPRLRIARCNAIPDCVCCESLVALSTPRFSYVNLFHHCLSIGPISHECRIAARISPRVRVKINPPPSLSLRFFSLFHRDRRDERWTRICSKLFQFYLATRYLLFRISREMDFLTDTRIR